MKKTRWIVVSRLGRWEALFNTTWTSHSSATAATDCEKEWTKDFSRERERECVWVCKRENPGRLFLLSIDAERWTKGTGLRNTVMSGGWLPPPQMLFWWLSTWIEQRKMVCVLYCMWLAAGKRECDRLLGQTRPDRTELSWAEPLQAQDDPLQ